MEQTFTMSRMTKVILSVSMLLMWLLITIPLIAFTGVRENDAGIYLLDEGWKVTINENVYKNVTISKLTFPVTQKGDVLTFQKKLPEDIKISNPMFKLLSVHSAYEMYLDGEKFYEYGMERLKEERMLGYGTNRVQLPEDYSGKELTIVMYVAEKDAFDGLQAFYIVDGSTIFRHELAENRFSLVISVFLLGFGALAMLFSVVAIFRNEEMLQVFCIAMFALLVAIWTMCNAGIFEILVPEIHIKSSFEYLTLYSADLPLTFYFFGRIKDKRCPKSLKIGFWILVAAETGFVILSAVLHALNIVHLPRLLVICHALFVCALLFILILAISFVRKCKHLNKSVGIGLSITGIVAFIEIVNFNLSKYLFGFKNNRYTGPLAILALIIVITLFADFVERIHGAVVEAAKKRLLENLAYMDELTALANRRKMDDTLVEFKEKKKNYAVINMDMNFLKTLNDTYGHEMGDRALQFFAGSLMKVFDKDSLVGRMGGDEFTVIIENPSVDKVERDIGKLYELLGDGVFPGTSVQLSFAAGYAFSYECSDMDDAYEIYRKSDARMYSNKREMKEKMKRE